MLKLIVILVLVIYLLNKLSFFLFRVLGRTQPPPNFRQPMNNDMNTDDPAKRTPKRGGGLKGGEYVDYEEVK